ncbi:MAG: PD-(D/E)XK nuclease family protein [Bacteroidetes bacterium]|nr:PD-(D/E)XK nuclease family protein [Bacteroidota bacterium]
MMADFLEKTAAYLVSAYGDNVSRLCIVLPNLRAGLFLRKFLALSINKTIWSPCICSTEDFLGQIAGLQPLEHLRLIFKLYEIHCDIEKDKAQAFEEFIQWAPQLLNDFDEVDRYLADARQLFSALTDTRALSVWNPENSELTDFQKQYLRFYNSLYVYYSRLVDDLLKNKQAYPGLMYRMASLGIGKFSLRLPWEKVIFAGFNALTAAEENVMDILHKQGQAEFLWDADDYYLNDKGHEAGEFLRHHRKKWGGKEFNWISSGIASEPKTIRITGVPGNTAQAALAGELLKTVNEYNEHTAVVLQDENLLIPLLYSLPPEAAEMNITMGLPLSQTPLSDLFSLALRMHINREKFNVNKGNGAKYFYFRDVLALLRHPFLADMANGLMDGNRFVYDSMIESISNGNKVFISPEEILNPGTGLFSVNAGFLHPFFSDWQTPPDAIRELKEIIGSFRDNLMKNKNSLELEYLFAYSKLIHQIEGLMINHPGTVKTLKTLAGLLLQVEESLTLPFYGEPLKGMQIMGMLETRGLDFRNIIMLSCNENLLPRGKSGNSFIPLDLKLEFKLPTYNQKDAVYAYHFYRLLQRAGRVHFLYNSEPGEFGSGEMSRFLQQILSELKRANPSADIKEEILVMAPSPSSLSPEISIEKDETVLTLLREKAENGFSPTSLNNFRACGLKFYFSDLAGLKEPDEIDEEIDNRILGNIVHEALHRLFKDFIGIELNAGLLNRMKTIADTAIDEACKKEFDGRDVNYGRNLLLVRVGKMMLKRFLESEIQYLAELKETGERLSIVGLEQRLERRLNITVGGQELLVKVKGFADRIDSTAACLRIVDYKTGSTDKRRTKVETWQEFAFDPAKDHAFQLLTYSWLYSARVRTGQKIQAGILSLRKLKGGLIPVSIPGTGDAPGQDRLSISDLDEFERILKQVLSAVFDPSIDFVQTRDLSICSKCSFIDLCGR